jgi:2-polyprenyl-3-methyl-5-hydroxy-6-metoxy-1,4-benzoquinol methylase
VAGDVTIAPFKNSGFDKIICSDVLEHISYWTIDIGELSRILKDDGVIAVTTPNNISMYGLQRKFVDTFLRWWRLGHPYDNRKNHFVLREVYASQGLNMSEVRRSCYFPKMVRDIYQWKAFLSSILSALKDMEKRFLSKNKLIKYSGYLIRLRLAKGHR